ncbi:MAG: outer membrane protein transport protein [Crocinitomicaceae bacterium]|nr:outer membrane protein transport protein [Crocinitomicaceae bacterium]
MKGKLFFISLCVPFFLCAQNEDDALRYSFLTFGGSARNISTAGSFGAVGGDYSVVSSNPAGLARFRKHNFSFTPAFEVPVVKTDFYGNQKTETDAKLKIGNFSYIKSYNLDPSKYNNWYGVQLGLGYNRIHTYQQNIFYSGVQDSSLLHSFIKQANGTLPANIYDAFPFDAALAWDTYALDPGAGNTYVTDFTSGEAYHVRSINRKGGAGEYSFTMSGNYANKLFLGGSFNLTRFRYSEQTEHKEFFTDTSLWIKSIRYLYDLNIEGWGYGARVRAIYLPVDWIRIGVSVQTPTLINLSDTWSANFWTDSDEGMKFIQPEYIPTGSYNYRITTPMRGNVSLGIIFKKKAAVGMDIEYVDYAAARLSSKKFSEAPYLFTLENSQVENIYKGVFNYKLGGEIRLTEQVYLRGGFAYYSSPYKPDKGNNLYSTFIYTGGAGYNFGKFYIDGALMLRQTKTDYYAYDPTIQGSYVSVMSNFISLSITGGFRFDQED